MIPTQYKNIDTPKKTSVVILLGLLAYNIPLITKYLLVGHITRGYNFSLYAFTYFNSGFIARGLIPTLLDILHLNNEVGFLVIYNITLFFYILSVIHIAQLHQLKENFYFIFSFIFLFFGIPHFFFDAFKTDMIIQLLAMLVYILLYKKRILFSVLVSFIAILVHEAALFLIIPLFLLLVNDSIYKKYGLVIFIFSGTFLMLSFSNKLEVYRAIEIIRNFIRTSENIPEMYYIYITNSVQENRTFFFKDFNLLKSPVEFSLYLLYFLILLYISKELLLKNIFKFNWAFLAPLLLCFVAVDWARWLCFTFFLSLLFLANSNLLSKQKFLILFWGTIFLGIPISALVQYSVLKIILQIIF